MAWFKREKRSDVSAADPVTADHWIVQRIEGSQATGTVTPDFAMKQSAVFACVRVLAETIASLPASIMERSEDRKEKNSAYDHPLFFLLHDEPNHYQTAFEFWEMCVAHINLRGNAYSFIERNGGGRIKRILPIHPDL